MAKSRLSVSASRVLLGLGVVGITTGAFAANVSGDIVQGNTTGATIGGANGSAVTITFDGRDNTLGTLGKYTSGGGSAENITGLTVTRGGNLTLNGIIGATNDQKANPYTSSITATKIIFGQGAKLYTKATSVLNGSIEFTGGNLIDVGGTTTATAVKSITVKSGDNDIKLGSNSLTLGDGGVNGDLILAGGNLTVTGDSTASVLKSAGTNGSVQMKGDSKLTIVKAKVESTKDIVITGANNTIDLSSGGIVSGGAGVGIKVDGSAKDAGSLTIKGNNSGGELVLGTNGLAIGHTNGNATLTLEKLGKSAEALDVKKVTLGVAGKTPNELIISQSFIKVGNGGNITSNAAGDTITLVSGSELSTSGAVTFNKGGTIFLDGGSTFKVDHTVDTIFKEGNSFITINDADSKFIANDTNGIKIGATDKSATLTIQGATAENFVAGAGGIKFLATNTKADGLTLRNSTIESKLTLTAGGTGVNTHTIKLDKDSKLTATGIGTASALKIDNKSVVNVIMEKGAELVSSIEVGGANKSELYIYGGKLTSETMQIGLASSANGKAELNNVESKITTLNLGKAGTPGTGDIVVNGGKTEITTLKVGDTGAAGTATFNGGEITIGTLDYQDISGNSLTFAKGANTEITNAVTLTGANANTKFTVDNSTLNFKGGLTATGTSNKAEFTLVGGKNDTAMIDITSGTADLSGVKFFVTTDGILEGQKILAQAAEGTTITKNTTEIAAGDFKYRQSVNDLIADQSLFHGKTYTGELATKSGSTTAIDGKSYLGDLLVEKFETKVVGNKLVLETTMKDASTVDIDDLVFAGAQDKVDFANNAKDGSITTAITNLEKQIAEADKLGLTKAQKDALIKEKTDLEKAKTDLNSYVTANSSITKENAMGALLGANGNVAMGNMAKETMSAQGNNDLAAKTIMAGTYGTMVQGLSNTGNTKEANSILASLASSKTLNNTAAEKLFANVNFFKDVRDDAKSISNMNDASTSVNAAISVANDMNISNRIATLNNPYQQLSDAKRFASLNSDAAFDYYDTYKRSVWANVFGGVNIIDSENGGLIGVSAGLDSYLTDNFLLGAHLTYANSTVDDGINEQKSNSFQLGVYSLYKFAPTWELNTRASLQFAPTDLTNNAKVNPYDTDFTRTSATLGANIGKVFSLSEGMYLKPFFGGNYYYTYTPGYERGSILGKTDDQSASSLSLELGAEFRVYTSENAYLYVTPKLEQYVLNSVDDFVGGFAGSTVNYTIKAEDEKKLYGQILIGGDYQVNEALSLNAGVGVKQILANKVNDNNETFVTGNVGLKYRF